jgi:histidinol-phosphate phosphatase family protein
MKVIFLDRDGVINKYPGDRLYVTSLKGFRFLKNAKKAIARLHKNNFRVFVISNQAGVGKGIFSQEALDRITKHMLSAVKRAGGKIQAAYYCTHQIEDNCLCRKPKTGLIKKAKKEHSLELSGSFFIGDTIRDIYTAKSAGLRSILVLCGKEKISNRKNWQIQPDFVFKDLFSAVDSILSLKKKAE